MLFQNRGYNINSEKCKLLDVYYNLLGNSLGSPESLYFLWSRGHCYRFDAEILLSGLGLGLSHSDTGSVLIIINNNNNNNNKQHPSINNNEQSGY